MMNAPRQRLLDAAGELFYRLGTATVGVDMVSKAAGVSKRTLYQHFGSKDQLVAASLDANGESILGLYLPDADSDDRPRDRILATFDQIRHLGSTPGFRGCPFINTCVELADPEHPARRVASAYRLRIRDYFARQAELGHASDPMLLADQLAIVFDGAIVQAVSGTSAHPEAAHAAAVALLDAHHVASE